MRVLVTGANGFLGSSICRVLTARGHEPIALVRAGADLSLLPQGIASVVGDITDPALANVLAGRGIDAVVHAAALLPAGRTDLTESLRVNVSGTRTMLAAAASAGARRWIQISSMSAHPANRAAYGGTKFLADEAVRASGLDWTILRPSLITGPAPRGMFFRAMRTLARLPVVPLVGGGADTLRPVHPDDVADAVAASLARPVAIGRTYEIGGADELTTREFFARTARAVRGKPIPAIALPLWLCRILALGAETILRDAPMTLDNVEGVASAQPVRIDDARRDLGFAPRGFDAILDEAAAAFSASAGAAP